jgi:DNA-binding transcriptional LysR family regulator
VLPLYRERYLLIASRQQGLPAPVVGWREAAALPLCLLTPDMQNRRIIDAAFRRAGAEPNVVAETGSILALYSFVQQGPVYSVVPHSLLYFSGLQGEFATAPLAPELSRQIGLVTVDRDPMSPLVAEAWAIAERLELQSRLETLISDAYRQIPANDC